MPFDSAPVETDSIVLALMRAKQRIEDPANWCVGDVARDASGEGAWPTEIGAVQFCAYGAVIAEQGGSMSGEPHDWLILACRELHGTNNYATVNNTLGHAAVMAMFDRAIALRREAR